MDSKSNIKIILKAVPILLIVFLCQQQQTYASGSLEIRNRGHHGRYTEVSVGSNRYYYDRGVFYTRSPDNYVVTEAPIGAVIYRVPSGHERVWIDGNVYYRYQDVYYRPASRGYEVVRVDRSREWERRQGQRRGHGSDREERHDQRGGR